MSKSGVCVAVLAHNEESRIEGCLQSLLSEGDHIDIYVLVNGSTDRTAEHCGTIARQHPNITVRDWDNGGKSRSWNRFVFDELEELYACHIFVDGDAFIEAGSVAALTETLTQNENANAAAGVPMNGRSVEHYQKEIVSINGLFGDLYALKGSFLERMRDEGIRLPNDLVGDDGLIASLAKTDLQNEDDWQDDRVVPCLAAGFHCEPTSFLRPSTWTVQYKRMISYSVRHFQNRIVSDIMGGSGPRALPTELSELYSDYIDKFGPRKTLPELWFDRLALRRIAKQAGR